VKLGFPVPVRVRSVRLYNPRPGDETNSTLQVSDARVRLFSDVEATQEVASARATNLSVDGTNVDFAEPLVRAVRVDLDRVQGRFYGIALSSLAEIEVIARGEDPALGPPAAPELLGARPIGP
jgi:hypothetical protein